jgi:hypothetical protein
MPYILNKTNGERVAIVQDASLDQTTDLIFVGKNYAGYGEWQNENFLHLLENFSNATPPLRPIEGQMWYDTSSKKLSVYDGENWKGISNIERGVESPAFSKKPVAGDLWYEENEEQLYVYNGSEYRLIGPLSGADTRAQWKGSYEVSEEDLNRKFNLKSIVGINDEVISLISSESYTVQSGPAGSDSFPVHPGTTVIKRGINLIGADPVTGVSADNTTSGILLWGTAAHALSATTATFSLGISPAVNTTTDAEHEVPFLLDNITYKDSNFSYNPAQGRVTADFFNGIASAARYADLAERYEADAVYSEGTVVVIGGTAEITTTSKRADTAVAGVVSKYPAFKMNSEAGSDLTHPYIALRGRVPCKVTGKIKKGERLVTAHRDGYAEAWRPGDDLGAVIGKALQTFEGLEGIIEILI